MNESTTTIETDVLILGGSISALMAASYLRHRAPQLDVTVLGPTPGEEKRPIVGESLVEPAILFFRRLGLGPYLDDEHALKNGLSFYHKLRADQPADRRYSVHAPAELHHLARQLHRPRFDWKLRECAAEQGVRLVDGRATAISLGPPHQIRADVDGREVRARCRWVVDATGRSRWLGKQVATYTRPRDQQRSCFWFRLADFEPFSEHLELSQRRPLNYDLWYTTHHFMGRGNWVWAIPLQSESHRRLVSVGITWRPDLFARPIQSVDDFLEQVDSEHPAVADMVRSGHVLDTQSYGNYLYWADHVYSHRGWFLLGDAARSVDPLYSTGLSMNVVQCEQIGEIICCWDTIKRQEIESLARLWMTIATQRQEDISDQYATMHHPFEACMRRYWNVTAWFNGLLPLWYNGLLHEPRTARLLADLFERGRPFTRSARALFARVDRQLAPEFTQEQFDRATDFDWLLNPRFDCPREEVPDHFGRMFAKRTALRWSLVRLGGYRQLLNQLPPIVAERLLAWLMPWLLRRQAGESFQPAESSPWAARAQRDAA